MLNHQLQDITTNSGQCETLEDAKQELIKMVWAAGFLAPSGYQIKKWIRLIDYNSSIFHARQVCSSQLFGMFVSGVCLGAATEAGKKEGRLWAGADMKEGN